MKRLVSIFTLILFSFGANAQLPKKISALPVASLPIFDSTMFPVADGSVTKKAYGWQLRAKIAGQKIDSVTFSMDSVLQWRGGVSYLVKKTDPYISRTLINDTSFSLTHISGKMDTVHWKGGSVAAAAYKTYEILLSNSSGTFTVKQLRNTIGNGSNDGALDIAWTNPSNGVLRGTMSGAPFTADKTFFLNPSLNNSGQPYFFTGKRITSSVIGFDLILYDGTQTVTPNFTDLPVEIRVYY